jgi:hypothetical protein
MSGKATPVDKAIDEYHELMRQYKEGIITAGILDVRVQCLFMDLWDTAMREMGE